MPGRSFSYSVSFKKCEGDVGLNGHPVVGHFEDVDLDNKLICKLEVFINLSYKLKFSSYIAHSCITYKLVLMSC